MKLIAEEVLDAAGCGDLTILRRYDKDLLNDNVCDSVGCNCLHYAARQGGADILDFLVNERSFLGYKRSNVGATAAHDAAAAGNLEALKWLLQYGGCSVDDQDGTGATVLHLAARFHHTDITEWLLDAKKADVSKRTASNGLPLHFAVVGGDYDAVKVLLDEDPTSVNYQLSNGATATYLAAQQGHLEILRLLIQDYRGNVKMKAYDGMSCVHAAAQSGHLDCVRFLVDEEKCNSNDRDFDGETPLHYAASQGHALVVDWLMKMGGAKVTLDNLGGSPLHNAAECNQIQCAKVLISNGCSTEITDNNGLTAAELARKCYNEKCANLIETFQPQSQFVIDEDIAYLHSVQSPRPATQQGHSVVTNGYHEYQTLSDVTDGYVPTYPSYNTHSYQADHQDSRNVNGTQTQVIHVTVHSGIDQQDKSRGRHSPVRAISPVNFRQEPAFLDRALLTDRRQEAEETGSVSARADSEEFPVGVPRNFSQDWSVDPECNQSGSSSSLSSLSNLDDAVAIATQEVEKDKISQNAAVYRKSEKQMLLPAQNQNILVETNSFPSAVFKNQQTNKRTDILLPEPREPKSVTFQAKTSYIKSDSFPLKMDESGKEENHRNERDSISHTVSKTGNNAVEKEMVKSNGFHDDNVDERKVRNGVHENNGSVIISQPVTNVYNHTAPQNARSHVTNLEMLKDNTHAMVNGNHSIHAMDDVYQTETSSSTQQTTPSALPLSFPSPVSLISEQNHVSKPMEHDFKLHSKNAPQMLGNGNTATPLSSQQTLPSITGSTFQHENDNQEQIVPQLTPPAPKLGIGNQQASVLPPPPPPPPPLPEAGKQSVRNSVSDEIKRKSASLPARPVGLFTAEMMKSQRSTLTPAQTRTAIDNSSTSDFIAELKQATKGPALRKTSKSAEPGAKPLTPALTFSSGHKSIAKDNNTYGDSKDSKSELTGEWDPKNFVDKVPNKESLPAWKVQLQARQIAEKTMKETLEVRKIEERESRFKNMPAWKRALVERKEKEAEAKIEEEKRLQEQQAQKRAGNKRVLAVNIQPKAGDSGKLAPWQQEVQRR